MVWDGEKKQLFDVVKLEFVLKETLCLPALRGRRVFPLPYRLSVSPSAFIYGQRINPSSHHMQACPDSARLTQLTPLGRAWGGGLTGRTAPELHTGTEHPSQLIIPNCF